MEYPAAKLWGIGMFIESQDKICYCKGNEKDSANDIICLHRDSDRHL
ncbi:MAG: hypothetical protein HFI94_01710 [Lachnospiraceae bacterium]|jgi:hypothetical protein|nr:hypothetical protein [Lachnospiraceae bacterium]